MSGNTWLLCGLAASILTAIASEANIFPEQWHHVLSLCGVVGTAITGFLARTPTNEAADRVDPKEPS